MLRYSVCWYVGVVNWKINSWSVRMGSIVLCQIKCDTIVYVMCCLCSVGCIDSMDDRLYLSKQITAQWRYDLFATRIGRATRLS